MNPMRRALITCIVAAITILSASVLFAFKFDFITVSDVVGNIKESFGAIETYQANFAILSEKLGKTTRQTGIIKYKANNKLHIEFTQPQGQKIVSNGKMMWIYSPSMNVVAEQDLDSGS